MGVTYYDAAGMVFGERVFTVTEFANRIGSPRAAKVLNELKTRGLVTRVARGKYRLLRPSERPDNRRAEWNRIRHAIMAAPMWKAWTGETAVEVWTRGRYKVSPSPFIRSFHVAIHESDRAAWLDYAKANRLPAGRKHIGGHLELDVVPDDRIIEEIEGEPVITRDEVVKLIRMKPSLYGEAEGLLARPR